MKISPAPDESASLSRISKPSKILPAKPEEISSSSPTETVPVSELPYRAICVIPCFFIRSFSGSSTFAEASIMWVNNDFSSSLS